ncbi:hypothetical protein [Streptomyces sp. NBC_00356]|uniref:hypothetical protein n=1 Tax=Streptomyces sp. NBC_00356 TaxID=2975724 RepID=UPI002E27412D
MAEMPGWFGVLGLELVVPGLLLVGVLGRGVEGVVGSRRVGVGVVRWGASVRGVSVRGFVVGVGWRDGPWVGVVGVFVGVFVTGPGVAVGATFGVWFGVGVVALESPVGVGVAVGAGRVGA